MSDLPPLSDRNLGWLRYLHRKATTTDSWDRDGHPHEHWDNTSEAPMLCYHRFDLIDSTYAVALMAVFALNWASPSLSVVRQKGSPSVNLLNTNFMSKADARPLSILAISASPNPFALSA